ncbi:MAG: SDR family NAD(P)-dependent oxidoreductase [Cyanobacteria bacterium P01_F01_bin.150]
MTTLKQKTVLLTGASRGIGPFIARALAQQEATIVGVARDLAQLDRVCNELRTSGVKCFSIAWDLSNSKSLPELIAKVEREAGPVDILINNAGIERYRAFQDYSLEDLQAVINVNLLAAMELSRLLLPGMLKRGSGHIVNMAPTAAKKGHPFDSAYSASKAGLLMWSDAIRQELAQSNVEVSVICPGYVEQAGMLADTGIPAPQLAGTTTPLAVAKAVVRAIEHNKAEVILNKDALSTGINKILFASWQFFPRFGDALYRAIGIPQLNQKRISLQNLDSVIPPPS